MRKILLSFILILSAALSHSQVLEPVKWSFRAEDKGDNNFEIVMTATLEKNWHLYAMEIEEGGPIATSFTFEPVEGYSLNGKPFAVTKPEVKFDNSFGMNIGMHSISAEFRQKVKVTGSSAKVTGYVTFMSCDDTQCLPPRDVEFSLEIKGTDLAKTQTTEIKSTALSAVSESEPSTAGTESGEKPESEIGRAHV